MRVGGFFVLLVRRNINQKKEKSKVKTVIAIALFAASIIEALAQDPGQGILPKGW
jgi:hypothetical protein